jgi:glutathionylspermidine synthase
MKGRMMYFSSLDNLEDFMNVSYLQDVAVQAGLDARYIDIGDVGYNTAFQSFVDMDENEIRHIFKLYPWEWLIRENTKYEMFSALSNSRTKWIEAPWKMILSNKAILPILWKLFPGHKNLLRAEFSPIDGPFVRKPVLSREGANVYLRADANTVVETGGQYEGPFVYQKYHKLAQHDGKTAVIGSWMVNGHAAGMGVREDESLITGNLSRFVPHIFA